MSFSQKRNKNISIYYLPNNFLAEKMILSCLLRNPKSMFLIMKSLSVESFYFKNHQEIFKILIFMYQNKLPIDIITLTTFIQDNGLFQRIGGVKVLLELNNQIPNYVYLNEYIRLVKEKYLRRLLIKFGYKVINSSYIMNIPLEKILEKCEEEINNLLITAKPKKLVSANELIYQIFLELKQRANQPQLSGLISGFSALDVLTQGFQKSDLIIIAGRPSIGKTAFSLTLCLNIIKIMKLPILFFSLEMSKEQLMYRLLSMETNINQMKLRSGKLSKIDWIKLNKIIQIFTRLPFFIDDNSSISIQEIRTKLKTLLSEQKQIGLIVIDYLQLMQISTKNYENRAQELSKLTRSLKNMAKEFNIPIIILSQLNRNIENRFNKKPILSDLRESGSIEQDADLVLMLTSKNKNSIIDLIIAKQRNGPTGSIKLKFNKKTTKYLNLNAQNQI